MIIADNGGYDSAELV